VKIINDKKQIDNREISINVKFWLVQGENEHPYLILLHRTGSLLKSLTVGFMDRFSLHDSFWGAICQPCSSLEILHISNMIIKDSISRLQTNTSIRNVTADDSDMSQDLLPELSFSVGIII
jgi:hypothetical protein